PVANPQKYSFSLSSPRDNKDFMVPSFLDNISPICAILISSKYRKAMTCWYLTGSIPSFRCRFLNSSACSRRAMVSPGSPLDQPGFDRASLSQTDTSSSIRGAYFFFRKYWLTSLLAIRKNQEEIEIPFH